jgi:hypothetical protein
MTDFDSRFMRMELETLRRTLSQVRTLSIVLAGR